MALDQAESGVFRQERLKRLMARLRGDELPEEEFAPPSILPTVVSRGAPAELHADEETTIDLALVSLALLIGGLIAGVGLGVALWPMGVAPKAIILGLVTMMVGVIVFRVARQIQLEDAQRRMRYDIREIEQATGSAERTAAD